MKINSFPRFEKCTFYIKLFVYANVVSVLTQDIDLPAAAPALVRPGESELPIAQFARSGLTPGRPEPGTVCPEPDMFGMQLITVNDEVEREIWSVYSGLAAGAGVTAEARAERLQQLEAVEAVRAGLEAALSSLAGRKILGPDARRAAERAVRPVEQAARKVSGGVRRNNKVEQEFSLKYVK